MWRLLLGAAWTAAAIALGYTWGHNRPAPASPPPRNAAAGGTEADPARALADCRRSLAVMGGVLDARLAAAAGPAAPFPPDLPPQYTSAGFGAAVRAAVAACEPERLRLLQVDCSEYPCAAVFAQPAGTYGGALSGLTSCPEWTSRFGGSEQGNGRFQTNEGPAEFSIVAALPDRLGFDKEGQTRWHTRYEAAREAAMDALGGREPTEIEDVEAEIAFWTHVRDKGRGDPATIEATLADLEARHALLVDED